MNKDMMPAHWTEDGPYGTPVSLKPAPIAWISRSPTNGDVLHWSKSQALKYSSDIYPLYGAPPKPDLLNQTCCECGRSGGYALYCGDCWEKASKREWQGLTDADKIVIRGSVDYNQFMSAGEYAERVQDATEAKLKEKNT